MGTPRMHIGKRAKTEQLLADVERQLAEIRARLSSGRASADDLSAAAGLAASLDDLRQELDTVAAQRPPLPPEGERPGVLLAVADVARRDALASWLDEHGLRVVATGSASTARTLVSATPDGFVLLITDVELDGGSGLGVATDMRARRPAVPVVLMSSAPPDTIVSRIPWAETQGETVVLERAISPQRLAAVVQALLRAAAR